MNARLVNQTRAIRRDVENERSAARSDVARELSIAITHLEDAEMRLARAVLRANRHPADAVNAVDKATTELLDPVEDSTEATEKEES